MKKNFKDQFENLGNIIQANIATIKDLLTQAENLTDLINQLEGNGDTPVKKQLEQTKDSITNSIENLIKHTHDLFNTYDKLVEELIKS